MPRPGSDGRKHSLREDADEVFVSGGEEGEVMEVPGWEWEYQALLKPHSVRSEMSRVAQPLPSLERLAG